MKSKKRKKPGRVRERLADKMAKSGPDEAVLHLLKSRSVDLSEKRQCSFYLYFPTKEKSDIAKKELNDSGFLTDTIKSVDGKNWLCLAEKEIVPDAKVLTGIRIQLEKLARKFGGNYDGWETGIDGEEDL